MTGTTSAYTREHLDGIDPTASICHKSGTHVRAHRVTVPRFDHWITTAAMVTYDKPMKKVPTHASRESFVLK